MDCTKGKAISDKINAFITIEKTIIDELNLNFGKGPIAGRRERGISTYVHITLIILTDIM